MHTRAQRSSSLNAFFLIIILKYYLAINLNFYHFTSRAWIAFEIQKFMGGGGGGELSLNKTGIINFPFVYFPFSLNTLPAYTRHHLIRVFQRSKTLDFTMCTARGDRCTTLQITICLPESDWKFSENHANDREARVGVIIWNTTLLQQKSFETYAHQYHDFYKISK